MTLRRSVMVVLSLIAIQCLTMGSALAQTRTGAVTIRFTSVSPFIAPLAGILILIIPRLLNYIVAIYLGNVGFFTINDRHLLAQGAYPAR